MEEAIALKRARNQREHSKNSTRENHDEYCLHDAKLISSKLLAATIRGSSAKSSHNAALSTGTVIWQPSQQFYPQSQAIQAIQQPQPIQEMLLPPPDNSSKPVSSSRRHNQKALPSFGSIMPITGGSATEFETKRQRNNYFRSVNTFINDGPATRPECAKVPITFTEQDFRL
jgi:hypothetical protein